MDQPFYLSLAFKTAPEHVRTKLMLTVSTQTGLDPIYQDLAPQRAVFQTIYNVYLLAAGKVTGRGGPTVDTKNEKLALATNALEVFGLAIETLAAREGNPVILTQLGFKITTTQLPNYSQMELGEGLFEVCARDQVKGNVRIVCTCTNTEGLKGFKVKYSPDEGVTWVDAGIASKFKLTVKNLPLEKKYLFICQPFGTWEREGSWTQVPVAVWVV